MIACYSNRLESARKCVASVVWVVVAGFVPAATLHAQYSASWTGGGTNTRWNNVNNWTSAAYPPGLNTIAIIDLNGSSQPRSEYVSYLPNSYSLWSVRVGNSSNSGENTNLTIGSSTSIRNQSTSYIGVGTNSTGSVDVYGTWNIRDESPTNETKDLKLGNASGASGTLRIHDGGTVVVRHSTYIGSGSGGTGSMTVDGSGANFTTGNTLQIGVSGSGSLTIDNDGSVTAGDLVLGAGLTNTSVLSLNGGTLTIGSLSESEGSQPATINLGDGTLRASADFTAAVVPTLLSGTTTTFDTNGRAVTFSGAISGGGGLLKSGSGTLTLSGENTFNGGVEVTEGTLALGADDVLPDAFVIVPGSGTLHLNGGTVDLGTQSDGVASFVLDAGTLTGTTGIQTGTLQSDADFDLRAGTIAGVLAGSSGLAKSTAGTVTISSSNTYSGATTVSGGTLVVDGSIATSSLTTVEEGGTLAGSGTTGALIIASGGTLAPGNSPGLMAVDGDLTLSGTLQLELGGTGTRGIDYDAIDVDGTLTMGGTLELISYEGFTPDVGDMFQVFTATSIGGSFSQINLTGFADGVVFDTSSLGTGWLSVSASPLSPVPEPSTWAAIAGATALLAAMSRRRRQKLTAASSS